MFYSDKMIKGLILVQKIYRKTFILYERNAELSLYNYIYQLKEIFAVELFLLNSVL